MSAHNCKIQKIKVAEQFCQEKGYVKCGANWYRCYGEGLLQIVTFQGIPEFGSSKKQTVSFGIYSLYDQIVWIDIPVIGVKRDLIPSIPSAYLNSEQGSSLDALDAVDLMISKGVPLLDTIDSHEKLAELLESVDVWEMGRILPNDTNKVIPYLLSGQTEKALLVIAAMERQNMEAHENNCRTLASYDREVEQRRMEEALCPYMRVRDSARINDPSDILTLLRTNYQLNIHRLSQMGIPLSVQDASDSELVLRMKM